MSSARTPSGRPIASAPSTLNLLDRLATGPLNRLEARLDKATEDWTGMRVDIGRLDEAQKELRRDLQDLVSVLRKREETVGSRRWAVWLVVLGFALNVALTAASLFR